jgi:hypothetical protein
MIESALVGVMDEETVGELTKAAQRFRGKIVKVTIIEVKENELKRGRKA